MARPQVHNLQVSVCATIVSQNGTCPILYLHLQVSVCATIVSQNGMCPILYLQLTSECLCHYCVTEWHVSHSIFTTYK